MPLRSARTVDDLFESVEGADLVFTHDTRLADALNARVATPHMGRFAATPRTWASDTTTLSDERHLFHAVVRETDIEWRDAAFAVEQILDCWDETGRPEAILADDRLDLPAIRAALPVVRDAESTRAQVAACDPPTDRQVAVIGRELLSPLDRSILPAGATDVSPFAGGTEPLPPFRIFDSRTTIVDSLLANVDRANAHRVAIVMDRDGPFPALVESALDVAEIPYHGGTEVGADPAIRECVGLARLARETGDPREADLRGFLREWGVDLPDGEHANSGDARDDPNMASITQFLASIEERTFGELLAAVEVWSGTTLNAFRSELDGMGVLDRRVTPDRVDDVAFYLRSFVRAADRAERGVLLADATAATFLDRPVVYHLGLDNGWTRPVPDRPWIDRERRDRQHRKRFELLLQNGQRPLFLVHDGDRTTPCLYFHDVLSDSFQEFADHDHRRYGRPERPRPDPFPHIPIQAPPDPPRTMSQSRLNVLANSPLDYCFDQLVETPDRDYFRKGTLFHDFAELCVDSPEFVEQLDRDELVAVMLSEMGTLVEGTDQARMATEFRVGTRIIERFLAERPPTIQRYDGYRPNFWSNRLADVFDRSITSPVTEQWFQSTDLGVSGVVDLLHDRTTLIDYKSGSAVPAETVVARASVDPLHQSPAFQAALYLAHHRRVVPDEPIDFIFFHFLDVLEDAIAGEYSLDDALVRIRYEPQTFPEFAASRGAYQALTESVDADHPQRRALVRLGVDRYRALVQSVDLPEVNDPDVALESASATEFRAEVLAALGHDRSAEIGCNRAIRSLYELRRRRFFRDDLDAFETFVADQQEALEAYHRQGFPVGEPNEARLRHPDMVGIDG